MRRFATTMVLLVLMAWPGGARSAEDPEWLVRLKAWSEAVAHHVPGEADVAVRDIGLWTSADLKETASDFLMLRRQLAEVTKQPALPGDRSPRGSIVHRQHRMSPDQLRDLAVFDGRLAADRNRVPRLAAMLHADVALLAPIDVSKSTDKPDTVQVLDGIVVGHVGQSSHWGVGRQLLEVIEPEPAADAFVRLWYHATAAWLLQDGNLAAAGPHLEDALNVLPSDAHVQYERGYFHQVSAIPSIQAFALNKARASTRTSITRYAESRALLSISEHRKKAELRFRKAVTLDPTHTEARVRLGLALLELNRVEDAAMQLRQAVTVDSDPVLSYVARLLVGQAEDRLGRREEAARWYREAAALFPMARSPRFGLASLLRRGGDRTTAWQVVEQATAPSAPEQVDTDPWWTFDQWQARPAKVLLEELRAMAREDTEP